MAENKIPVKIIKTDKFKSITGMLCFKMPIKEEKLVPRLLLRKILMHSCKKYPTSEAISINCLENYGAKYMANTSREGNYIINTFIFSTLEDKYTEEGNFKKVIDTFYELVFNPNVKNNAFDKEIFDYFYKIEKSIIESIIERPTSYAVNKLNEKLDSTSPISYKEKIEDLEKVTPESLYKEYLDMINNSEVDFILTGNIDKEQEDIKIITDSLKTTKYDKELIIKNNLERQNFNESIEEYDGKQSILTLGIKLDNLTDFERTYVLPIYSGILGGGAASRLFSIIREENSLSYYCYSRYYKDDNLLYIFAGIDKENYSKALGLMKEILSSMKKVTEDEVSLVKENIISVLKESEDNLGNYSVNYYFNKLFNEPKVNEKIENISKVKVKDVENIFDKVHLTDSYFLKGEK